MLVLTAPWLVVAMALVSLVLILCRKGWPSIISLVITLAFNAYTEQIPFRLKHTLPAEKEPWSIRILEYNICGRYEYYQIHPKPEFVQYVLDQDADILFLPENSAGVAPNLEDSLKVHYPYNLHQFEEFESKANASFDYTLYSRFPLTGYKNYQLNKEEFYKAHAYLDSALVQMYDTHFMAYEVTADIAGQPVTLLHLHMRSNSYDVGRQEGEGRKDKLKRIYKHLFAGYAFREAEARIIADSLGDCPNPLIISGDFNDLSSSRSLRIIQDMRRENVNENHRDRLNDAWWCGGQGFGFTFTDLNLLLRLDHILYSKEFELQAVKVDDQPYSDHHPLIADFKFNTSEHYAE